MTVWFSDNGITMKGMIIAPILPIAELKPIPDDRFKVE